MNTALAVGSNPNLADDSAVGRSALAGVFVLVGLILLYAAGRIVRRRNHPVRPDHRRY